MQPANTPAEPTQTDPQQDRTGSPVPENIAFLLHIVQTLIAFGRYFGETLHDRRNSKLFTIVAVAFGTHRIDRILNHVRRGLRRAIALERYLLARAKKGLEVPPVTQPGCETEEDSLAPAEPLGHTRTRRNPPHPPGTPEIRLPETHPDDIATFYIPSMKELALEVRRRPIGRSIDAICMDFGVIFPEFCTKPFYNLLIDAQTWFGGNFTMTRHVRARRQESFETERRAGWGEPDCYWWERQPEKVRQVLGCLVGEDPPPLGRDLYYLDWPPPLDGVVSPFDTPPPKDPPGPPPVTVPS